MAPPVGQSKLKEIKKEDVLQAVVILESFDNELKALTTVQPKALLPLVNCPIIEYILEFLHSSGIHEVLLFCCLYADKIKDYLRKTRWMDAGATMKVIFVISESCMSVGDVLRDIYDKRLVRDDFILVDGNVISNVQLKPILDNFRERRKKDKANVMTACYKQCEPRCPVLQAESLKIVAYDSQTYRILHHQVVSNSRKIAIPLVVFKENSRVTVCHNLLDCHLYVCSPDVLSLFADNFDYQTVDNFIKGIVEHEEVLGNTIYMNFIENEYAASVINFLSYKAISNDIINRWLFPIVPDLFTVKEQNLYRRLHYNIYRPKDVTVSRSSCLEEDVVIGSGSKVGNDTVISTSVIGRNCKIGDGVTLRNAYIWDNVTIKNFCVVDTCILAKNVVLEEHCTLSNCILSFGVEFGPHGNSENIFLASKVTDEHDDFSDDEDDKDSVESRSVDNNEPVVRLWDSLRSADAVYESSEDESYDEDFKDRDSPQLDDAKLFYAEVLDTLTRGIVENLKSENLVLEINGLKYAYNVTMAEVNFLVMKAILEIPVKQGTDIMDTTSYLTCLKKCMSQFISLLRNYIKSGESQLDILNCLKEYCNIHRLLLSIVMKIVHFLYENDILEEDTIVEWFEELVVTDEIDNMLKEKLLPFIKWLKEAEEESE